MINIDKDTLAILGAILTSWITLQTTVAVLKSQMSRMQKDIDGIAEFVGTPTALARKKTKEE